MAPENNIRDRPTTPRRKRAVTILLLKADIESCLGNDQLPTHILWIQGDWRKDDPRWVRVRVEL